jgi:nucleotide-binding universal stress UspA family protein
MRYGYEQKIVVGVDGTDGSLVAVDLAAAEAQQRKAPLLLLWAHPTPGLAGSPVALTAVLRRVCATWPDVRATAHNITGEPAEALIEASRTATLVVVGRGGREDGRGPGTVCARVAAHAMSPTLVVPTMPGSIEGPVLLGLGMSPDDEATTGFAFEEASLRQAPLLAVHVWSGIPANALRTVSPYAYDLYEAQAAADRMLAESLAGWSEKYPDIQVNRMPLYDANPARTLLDASALAGLVVVGARRHGRRSSQLLGTVARTLISGAGCPVAVVRQPHLL